MEASLRFCNKSLYNRAVRANNLAIRARGGDAMFNIGASELILLLLIAFIVVGPKDLPRIARALGRLVRSVRAMVEEVRRETGLDEIEADVKGAQQSLERDLHAADVRPDLQKAQLEMNRELSAVKKDLSFQEFRNQSNKHVGGNKQ